MSVLLIDLSSIVHRHWHACTTDPNPDATSIASLAQVHRLASNHEHVAICCDSGKSFRAEVNPSYKATRPKERNEPLYHQMAIVRESLQRDGFPVWAVPGFEADDLIATAVRRVLEHDETTPVLVASADKDLLALVGPRVAVKSTQTGNVLDEAGVVEKFGVRPEQMTDYLTIVGDASDNITGIKGVGAKGAVKLLTTFGSLVELYTDLAKLDAAGLKEAGITPALHAALDAFADRLDETRTLVKLRDDVEIPFDDIWKPRVAEGSDPDDGLGLESDEMTDVFDDPDATPEQIGEAFVRDITTPRPVEPQEPPQEAVQTAPQAEDRQDVAPVTPRPTQALVVRPAEVLPAPAQYELQLDPRDLNQAFKLGMSLYKGRMFAGYGSGEAVLSTVMAGRELGLPAIASLRAFHVIEGKMSLSAGAMVALVLKSGLAEYFEPLEFSETSATYETKRKGARNPVKLTHTIEMARKAWSKGKTAAEQEESWQKSGWGKNPTDMLVARATARLCRMVYADLLAGLYSPEELLEQAS